MEHVFQWSALAAAVGSGLVAGLCFTFHSFLMQALSWLGPRAAILAMQSINDVILRSSAMAVWFGTLVAGGMALLAAEERALPGLALGLYALGALVVTGAGNVPLNEHLDQVDPESDGAPAEWQRYVDRWGRLNLIRTVAMASASAAFAFSA